MSVSLAAYSQNDTLVLKVHSCVGNKIDINEKIKYNLFTDVPNRTYKYAQYLSINNEIILRTTLKDGEYFDQQYKIEWVLNDGKQIEVSQFEINSISNSIESNKNLTRNKIRLKLIDHENGKSQYLKEGMFCYLLLYPNLDNISKSTIYNEQIEAKFRNKSKFERVKILKIIEGDIASVKIKQIERFGKKKIIFLSDIKEIKKHVGITFRHVLGIGSFGFGGVISLAVLSGAPLALLILPVPFFYFGVKLCSNNHKFDLSNNSEIGIVYI